MSFIEVTSEELKNKASELQGLNARYQAEIENIINCQNNLNTMWEGEAKEAFNQVFNRNRTVLDSFKTAIDSYIQALNVIASRYDEAEKRNIAMAGSGAY